MAKLHGAAKAKFLARMARGRAKSRRNPSKRRRRNPLRARHDISRGEEITRTMLENPVAYVVNPGEQPMAKRHKKSPKHRRSNAKRKHHGKRRANPITYANRRRRNPISYSNPLGGIGPLVGMAVPAVSAGFVASFVDAQFLSSMNPIIRYGARVALAVGAGMALKKRPAMATAAMAGILGSMGGELGTRMGGGLVAASKKAGMKELAAMAADDGDLALLMKEELSGYGLGLIASESSMGDDGDLSGDEDMGAGDDVSIDAEFDEAA